MVETMKLEIIYHGDSKTIIDILESLRMVVKVRNLN